MAVDIQSNTISQTDEPTLDGVLHHHLRLEPPPQPGKLVVEHVNY